MCEVRCALIQFFARGISKAEVAEIVSETIYGCNSLCFEDFMRVIHEIKKNDRMEEELQDHSMQEAEFLASGVDGNLYSGSEASKPLVPICTDDGANSTQNFWKDTPQGINKAKDLPPNPPKEKKSAPSRYWRERSWCRCVRCKVLHPVGVGVEVRL